MSMTSELGPHLLADSRRLGKSWARSAMNSVPALSSCSENFDHLSTTAIDTGRPFRHSPLKLLTILLEMALFPTEL